MFCQSEEKIILEAKKQQWVQDTFWEAEGEVKLVYKGMTLTADKVRLDWVNKKVEAWGDVEFVEGNNRFRCASLTYDLESRQGTFLQAEGSFEGDYYFKSQSLSRIGEKSFTLTRGMFTSCSLENPPWSLTLKKARITLEDYAYINGVAFRVKHLPVIYIPYLVWPTKMERARGFLMPHYGHTFKRGFYLGLAYFLPIGESYDLLTIGDWYSKGWYGTGLRFRYHPIENLKGEALTYYVRDNWGQEWWKVRWTHEHLNLPGGFTLRGDVTFLSDINFFREFEKAFDRNTNRSALSYFTLSRNGKVMDFTGRVEYKETVFSSQTTDDRSLITRQTPEMEWRLRPLRLSKGFPLYLSGKGGAHLFFADRPNQYKGSWYRLDLFPTVSFPFVSFPWLSLNPKLSYRWTYYSKVLEEGKLVDEPFLREALIGEATLSGPSFSRIFSTPWGKVKHLIEPRWEYSRITHQEAQDIPLFDENDVLLSKELLKVSLIQRFFWKASPEKPATEVASLEFTQSYSLNPEQPLSRVPYPENPRSSPYSALGMLLRLYPSSHFNLDFRWYFNPITRAWENLNLSSSLRFGTNYVNLTWFKTRPQVSTQPDQDQFRIYTGLKMSRRWQTVLQLNYDLARREAPQQRYLIKYLGSCWGLSMEYRDYRLGDRQDREYRITIDLKNVGSFIDFTGGVDNLFGGKS